MIDCIGLELDEFFVWEITRFTYSVLGHILFARIVTLSNEPMKR